jgi:hypothetical protein
MRVAEEAVRHTLGFVMTIREKSGRKLATCALEEEDGGARRTGESISSSVAHGNSPAYSLSRFSRNVIDTM